MGTYKTQLGIADASITAVSTLLATYKMALGAMNNAKKAQNTATQTKKAAQKAIVTAERAIIRRVQAAPGATTAIRAALGINKRTGQKTKTPPTIPTKVIATASADGINTLKWDRNGNKPATTFRVEMMGQGDKEWNFIGNTTKTKFDHTGQTPGVTIYYRITATRQIWKANRRRPSACMPRPRKPRSEWRHNIGAACCFAALTATNERCPSSCLINRAKRRAIFSSHSSQKSVRDDSISDYSTLRRNCPV